ncbi:MAG: right-handed parallel beta-helix repeat-containing protein [Anaerolineae bacterium]|nr:right-handed parallel beta-helix repeat-containing protein [Anaerolineae bacterium]
MYGGFYNIGAYAGQIGSLVAEGGAVSIDHTQVSQSGVTTTYGAVAARNGGTLTIANSTISDNADAGNYAGVYVNSASLSLTNSTVANNRYGVRVDTTSALNITDNTFDSNQTGLYIDNATAPGIVNNVFENNSIEAINLVLDASMSTSFANISGNTLTNNGVNGLKISGTVGRDTTFSALAGLPYVIWNGLTINAARTLTIQAGALLKFSSPAFGSITVNGTLLAQGDSGNQVTLTSVKDDVHGGDTNNDGSASTPRQGRLG